VAGGLRRRAGTQVPDAVAAYLDEVEAAMPPRRASRAALAELADGLADATEHHLARGAAPAAAAARAVDECGPASVVAARFADVLTTHDARRTATTLLFTGPAVGLLWLVALVPGRTPDVLLSRLPLLPVLVAVAAAAGALTIRATGHSPSRLLREQLTAVRTAATACTAAAICDVVVISAAIAVAAPSASARPAVVAAAAAVSLTRLALALGFLKRNSRRLATG
jgi:hypothetical protein